MSDEKEHITGWSVSSWVHPPSPSPTDKSAGHVSWGNPYRRRISGLGHDVAVYRQAWLVRREDLSEVRSYGKLLRCTDDFALLPHMSGLGYCTVSY